MSADINFAILLPDLKQIILGSAVEFGGIRSDGTGWNSGRISWDGFRNISVSGSTLTGEAFSPLSDGWTPFTLDLISGNCVGAVYPKEMARAVQIRRSKT
jgi:hypothetical protein